jgi:hypothetical protein
MRSVVGEGLKVRGSHPVDIQKQLLDLGINQTEMLDSTAKPHRALGGTVH